MKLKKLILKNFLSHESSEIDFDNVGKVALIIGKCNGSTETSNGAGKTSIIEAILYALFEKSRVSENKNITLNELVRRNSDGEMSVELQFELHGTMYRIIRTRNSKKNKGSCAFEVKNSAGWKPKTEEKKDSTNKAILDTINIDYKTFVTSICFQQEEVDRFVKATDTERKEIIRNILQLDRYNDYKNTAKAKLDVINDELKGIEKVLGERSINPLDLEVKKKELGDVEKKIGIYSLEKEALQRQLEKLRKEQILFNQQVEKKQSLEGRLVTHRAMHKKLTTSLQDALTKQEDYSKILEAKKLEFHSLEGEYNAIKDKFLSDKSELMTLGKKASEKLKEVELELEKAQEVCFSLKGQITAKDKEISSVHELKHDSKCPTCFSAITTSSKDSATTILSQSKQELENRLETASSKLETIKGSQRHAASEVEKLKERVVEYNAWVKEKNNLKQRLISLKEDGTNAKQIVTDQKASITENQALLEQYNTEINQLDKDIADIVVDTKAFEDLNKRATEKSTELDRANTLLNNALVSKGQLTVSLADGEKALKSIQEFSKQREKLQIEKFYYTQLVEMFGKEIPSLIIENSCAELELKTNEVLASFSDLTVSFITQQTTLKGDLKEVFEVLVKKPNIKEPFYIDSLSNGQKFRVVFAIRIALSRLLARRHGSTPIEFLFYDECFASLDNEGIDQVIDIFKYLQKDFKHQLIITHQSDLKERFGDNVITVNMKKGVSQVAI